MPPENIKLAWDIQQDKVTINGINVVVVPSKLAPENVKAVVEEQDTALVIGAPTDICVADDSPSWVLANRLESQAIYKPGNVVIRKGTTITLLAIVHDLDQDPTWKSEWISQSLDNIFNLTRSRDITTLQLPVLGAQHGRFDLKEFLSLLMQKLNDYNGPLRKIWLTVDSNDCLVALSHLKEIGK